MSLLLLMGDSTPSIGSLFASGEAGLALDVETAYLRGWVFQDSAGASVAAAAGDPVGLILDTAKGGLDSLGSDLVSNGTFATDTVWSKGANWTIGSGVATKTGGAANNLTQTITSTAGLWYRITMDVTRTAGELTVSLGTSGTTRVINASGSYTFFILAGSSTQTLTLAGDSSFAGTVDNVTARLVPGNHAYQTTSGSRPALARTPDGGRRNLLTYSEASTGATSGSPGTAPSGWSATSAIGTVSTSVSSNGLRVTISVGGYSLFQTISVAANTTYCFSCICDVHTATAIHQMFEFISFPAGATVTKFQDGVALSAFQAVSVRNNTKLELVLAVGATAGTVQCRFGGGINVQNDNMDVTFRQFQFEVGSTRTTYQRVGLTSDVTESGKRDCWGLLFDGSDDSLQTASVDFSATDKMTVMAGVRKLSDAASGGVAELTGSVSANNGSFGLFEPSGAASKLAFASRGTSTEFAETSVTAAWAAPSTSVLTGQANISAPSVSVRRNSVSVASSTNTQGTGNYSNAIVYIGSRGGSSLRFNGILYTLIVRGATTPTGTIADFERNLLAKRAGITF